MSQAVEAHLPRKDFKLGMVPYMPLLVQCSLYLVVDYILLNVAFSIKWQSWMNAFVCFLDKEWESEKSIHISLI